MEPTLESRVIKLEELVDKLINLPEKLNELEERTEESLSKLISQRYQDKTEKKKSSTKKGKQNRSYYQELINTKDSNIDFKKFASQVLGVVKKAEKYLAKNKKSGEPPLALYGRFFRSEWKSFESSKKDKLKTIYDSGIDLSQFGYNYDKYLTNEENDEEDSSSSSSDEQSLGERYSSSSD